MGDRRLATFTISRDAAELLDLSFLFFRDADRSRCAVLYPRYDGHQRLITPADEPEDRFR